MDSINREQPEVNRRDVAGGEALDRLRSVVKKTETCFFCTSSGTGDSNGARPMNVRQVDDHGHLWFFSADDSHKNQEIEAEPSVTLYFQGTEHSDFLRLEGRATISRDRKKIEELWSPLIRTWFTGGKDDPRITVIRVAPSRGYYWDNKHGNAIAGMKMVIGAATGTTLDDSIEGTVRL